MALQLLAANNAQSVLAAGISASATSLTLNTGTGALFPSPVSGTSFFKLTLIDAATGSLTEIVHVTARAGDVFTIQRGQEGTVPRAWSANDIAANMMTAGTLSYILDNYATIASLGTAAAKNVGTGPGQIPDMSAFTSGPGWVRFPDGTTIQQGSAGFATGVNNQYVTLPRAFSSANFRVATVWNDVGVPQGGATAQAAADIGLGAGTKTTTRFGLWQGGSGGFNVDWIAIGVS